MAPAGSEITQNDASLTIIPKIVRETRFQPIREITSAGHDQSRRITAARAAAPRPCTPTPNRRAPRHETRLPVLPASGDNTPANDWRSTSALAHRQTASTRWVTEAVRFGQPRNPPKAGRGISAICLREPECSVWRTIRARPSVRYRPGSGREAKTAKPGKTPVASPRASVPPNAVRDLTCHPNHPAAVRLPLVDRILTDRLVVGSPARGRPPVPDRQPSRR